MMGRTGIYVVFAIITLGGLFFLFQPTKQLSSPSTVNIQNVGTPTAEPQRKNPEFSLRISDRKITEGSNTITVKQGQMVTLRIISDEDEEFHIHGYDKSVALSKDVPAILTFTADTAGRFPFELEENGIELGSVDVQPK